MCSFFNLFRHRMSLVSHTCLIAVRRYTLWHVYAFMTIKLFEMNWNWVFNLMVFSVLCGKEITWNVTKFQLHDTVMSKKWSAQPHIVNTFIQNNDYIIYSDYTPNTWVHILYDIFMALHFHQLVFSRSCHILPHIHLYWYHYWGQRSIKWLLKTWCSHDDVIKWKHFPRNWPFVRGIHRSRWIPRTKASDAELWCFLWSVSE